jgi:hypothetical protein
MLVEFAGNQMNFQTISRKGQAVDTGEIQRQVPSSANASPQALYVPGAQLPADSHGRSARTN